ncbi:MAG: hypothetical protein ACLVHY_05620 [Gemmiger sp.]
MPVGRPMLVEMPDIIGWTQNNASKLDDPASVSMQIIGMASTQRLRCKCDEQAPFDADGAVVTVHIAGARNDAFALVSSPTPSEQPNWADSTNPAATTAP